MKLKPIKAIRTRLKKFKASRLKNRLLNDKIPKLKKLRIYVEVLKPKISKNLKRNFLKWLRTTDALFIEEKHIPLIMNYVDENSEKHNSNLHLDDFKIWLTALRFLQSAFERPDSVDLAGVGGTDVIQFLDYLFGVMVDERWEYFTKKEKTQIIIHMISIWNNILGKNPEGAKSFGRLLLNYSKDLNQSSLTPEQRIRIITEVGTIHFGVAETYLKCISLLVRTGFNFEAQTNFRPKNVLKLVVTQYLSSVESGELGLLEDVQEMVRDLALAMSSEFFNFSESIFENATKDQFSTLCAKLAEENLDLVELVGKKLFEKEEAA